MLLHATVLPVYKSTRSAPTHAERLKEKINARRLFSSFCSFLPYKGGRVLAVPRQLQSRRPIFLTTGFSDATVAKRTYITLKLLQKSVSYFSFYKVITLSFNVFQNFDSGMCLFTTKITAFLREKCIFFIEKFVFVYSFLFFPLFN